MDVALSPPAAMVDGALRTAREMLDMDVAYLTQFDGVCESFMHIDGDAAGFALEQGMRVALEESYCEKMVTGQIGNIVTNVSSNPVLGELELTKRGRVGSYV